MDTNLIDVKDIIEKFSISELNEAAEQYWKRLVNNPRLLAKPYNIGDAEHILPQLGFLIQGLQLYAGMTVLDFGAGSCYASRILNQLGSRVISMDVSGTALDIGKRLAQRWPPIGDIPEHVFSVFDGRRFDLPDSSVDRIFCLDAFHHVPDQEAVLREMGRVLKHGGIAGFSEPGPNHSKTTEAQMEMRNCNVVENDIILSDLFETSREYGFTDLRVSISTIHPPLVPLENVDDYLAKPEAFAQGIRERVTNFPIFFLYKGDPTIRDSRNPGGLCAKIMPHRRRISVNGGEPVKLFVDVVNTSAKTWLASGNRSGCVNLGAILRHQTHANLSTGKEYRFLVSNTDVEPGSIVSGLEMDLGPLTTGKYSLDIDLVSEYVCWFQSHSDSMVTVDVSVL
ncbi:MAG: methyltransferase domain-containing protein [Acidobacteriaceae bacterium]|nr:methyltransferase domain-containing protein [Acidobacteriaceae bacterium]